MMVAQNSNWSEGHSACLIIDETESDVRVLVPRSPRTKCVTHFHHCTTIG